MPKQLDGKLLRLALNTGTYDGFVDQLTRSRPKIPIGDLRIEVGLFYHPLNADRALHAVDNIVSITASIKALVDGAAPPAEAPALIPEKTVGAIDATLNIATWDDLTKQHAYFIFPEAETSALSPGLVWLVFTALLANGKTVPLKFGAIEAVQDGAGISAEAPEPAVNYYTAAQADTRFLAMRLGITNRTGGGGTGIDGIAVAGGAYPVNTAILSRTGYNGAAEVWMLLPGAQVENADNGIISPDDGSAFHWKQLL
ncbi:MAG: hypothetical protein K0R17_2233 [Rariglobus sp.]|jgi:hypothetical protein|nr:hypothetical protein [Rariglobus sp.]